MAILLYVVIAAIFAINVHCTFPMYDGECPEMPSKVEDVDIKLGESIKWYSLYSTSTDMEIYNCYTSKLVEKNETVIHIETTFYNSTGSRDEFLIDAEKIADGKYKYSFFCPEVNQTVTNYISIVAEGSDCMMWWSCVNFNNGSHTEEATVVSTKTSIPEEHVELYEGYLKDHKSSLGKLKKYSYENCPSEK